MLKTDYEITEVFTPEAAYDNGTVKGAFGIAKTGGIATLETIEGEVYIIMKKDKLDEILENIKNKEPENE